MTLSFLPQSRKTMLTILTIILIFISLGINFNGLKKFFAGDSFSVEERIALIQNTQTELDRLLLEQEKLNGLKAAIVPRQQEFWFPERDGDPARELRKKIEVAAKESNLLFKMVGSLQRDKLSDFADRLEIQLTADTGFQEITAFLAAIRRQGAFFKWKSVAIFPDNPNRPVFLIFSGILQITVIHDRDFAAKIWEDR